MQRTTFTKTAAGALAALALSAAPTLVTPPYAAAATAAGAQVSTGHSSWDWGFPSPQGQDLEAVAFSGSTGYAVGAFGTVMRSADSGATWTGVASGTTSYLGLVQEVSPTTVVVAGGCDVSESTNGGASFTALPLNLGNADCNNAVQGISFSDPMHGYVALNDGSLYYTDDGGATLQAKTSVPTGDGNVTGITFTTPTSGFAITSDGAIQRTTDGGNSWTLVHQASAGLAAITFVGSGQAYAVGAGGLMLGSTDGGQAWSVLPLKITSGGAARDLTGIACSSATQCLITTGQGALIGTTDGGQTGTIVSPSNENLNGVAFAAGSTAVAVGDQGATVVSTDGGATFPSESSSNLRLFQAVGSSIVGGVGGSAYIGGQNGEIAATTDAGADWNELRVPTAAAIDSVQFPTAQTGYALDDNGALRSTSNGGVSWMSFPGRHDRLATLAAPATNTVLLVGPKGIQRSTDGGSSFVSVAGKLVVTRVVGHGRVVRGAGAPVSSLQLSQAVTRGSDVLAWGPSGIVVSSDGGTSWTQVPAPVKTGELRGVSFVGPKLLWVLAGRGRLFSTIDGGRAWTESASAGAIGGLTTVSFANPRDGMIGLAPGDQLQGTTFGQVTLLSTTDGGTTWQPEIVNGGSAPAVLDTNAGAYLADTTQSSGNSSDENQGASFFATLGQGRVGSPTALTLTLGARHISAAQLLKAGHKVVIRGTLSPVTVTGQTVAISYGGPAGAWKLARTRVATDGTFSVTIPGITTTTEFVAQSLGNGSVDAAATKPVTLTVKP